MAERRVEHISIQNRKGKKAFSCSTFSRLFSYYHKDGWVLLLIFLVCCIGTFCTLSAPYILGVAIDYCVEEYTTANSEMDFEKLTLLLFYFLLANALSALCIWTQEFLMKRITIKVIRNLRSKLFQKFLSLKLKNIHKNKRGELLSNFINDTDLINNALGNSLTSLFCSLTTLIGSLIIMLYHHATLTLVACTTIPLTLILSRYIIRHTRKYFTIQQNALAHLNGMVEEDICGMRTIQTFGQEKNRLKRFDQLNEKVRKSGEKAQIYSGILMPLLRILDNLCFLFVTVYGALLASRGAISVGMIQTFLLYTRNFQRPVNTIATQLNLIQSALAGADRIFQLLDNPETEETYASTLPDCTTKITFRHGPKIEFCDLSFKYSEESPVLNNISFEINENETVALVGATGAGKSTIVDLLARFIEPDSGCIKIDGKETQTIPLPHLRSLMSIVLQESFLFSESIGYNIGYGESSAKQSEIVHVAQLANIEDFIERQPNRYDQILNRQELGISHGQKQLVTIARALLTESPILILDEATSSIDSRTESLIQQAINKLTQNKTCLVIAHRLSTIKQADKIIVLHNGNIVECGKHEELFAKKGKYWEICTNKKP